ncbi:MAG: hypothetical protein K2X27_03305, partial [Candidatus Obscuribacterales bacterium]|nr:hypothetical protein [Candidatus Obscuribacterales bacterium]
RMSSRLHRLIRLVRIVRGKSYPDVKDLCRILEIKERTLFGDLRELKDDLGVEIRYDRCRRGYILENHDGSLSFTSLTEETAFLLLAAFDLLDCSGGEGLASPLREAFEDEIELCLKAIRNGRVPDQILKHECKPTEKIRSDIFIRLCLACSKSEPVTINIGDIRLPGKRKRRNGDFSIVPKQLVYSNHNWQLSYLDKVDSQTLRTLDLSSIQMLASS